MYGNKIYSLRYLNLPTAGLIKPYTLAVQIDTNNHWRNQLFDYRFHKFCYMKQMEWMVNNNRIGAKKVKYTNGLIFFICAQFVHEVSSTV